MSLFEGPRHLRESLLILVLLILPWSIPVANSEGNRNNIDPSLRSSRNINPKNVKTISIPELTIPVFEIKFESQNRRIHDPTSTLPFDKGPLPFDKGPLPFDKGPFGAQRVNAVFDDSRSDRKLKEFLESLSLDRYRVLSRDQIVTIDDGGFSMELIFASIIQNRHNGQIIVWGIDK